MRPEMRIVMMSGYEDFEAVRQALSFGADAYLTKPLNIAELGRVLTKVASTLNTSADETFEKAQLLKTVESMGPILRERLLRDLLLGVRSMASFAARDEAKAAGLFQAREKLAVLLLEVEQGAASGCMEAIIALVREALSGMSQALALSEPVVIHGGMLGFIAFMPRRMDDEAAFDHLQQCSSHMVERAQKAIGCPVTIAISSVLEDETALASLYCQALDTLRKYAGHGANRAYWHEPPGEDEALPDARAVSQEILELASQKDSKAGESACAFVDKLVSAGASMEETKGGCCDLLAAIAALAARKGQDSPFGNMSATFTRIISARYVAEIKERLMGLMESQSDERQPKSHSQAFAEKASAFMRENYRMDLSTERIAKEVFVTPAHLRRVFKNVTGQTIQEYLLAIRMDKARELLRRTDARVLDVARDVGYQNPSYFNIVFRKYFGKPPGEFRIGEKDA
jgi:two-component system response regulator YesN